MPTKRYISTYDISLVERIDFIRRKPEIKETRQKFISTAMRERAERLERQYLDVWANGIPRKE